jgi:hypothetical protein
MARPRALRTVLRATSAAVSLVLAVAVVVTASQAGRRYVYCRAMQEVMSHVCCSPEGTACPSDAPVAAASAPECCELRSIPSPAAWTPVARAIEFSAPWVAVVPRSLADLAASTSPEGLSGRDLVMRTGPPQSRELARLMVFRI